MKQSWTIAQKYINKCEKPMVDLDKRHFRCYKTGAKMPLKLAAAIPGMWIMLISRTSKGDDAIQTKVECKNMKPLKKGKL